MIKFTLACDANHAFEAWFGSSDDFEAQKTRDLVCCPVCGSSRVEKSLMAPSVSTSKTREKINVATVDKTRQALFAEMKQMRERITANAENVGQNFPEEARKIHYGESEQRGIYGEASPDDVKELVEEGVQIAPLPIVPEDAN